MTSTRQAGQGCMIGTVSGTVTTVTDAKIFTARKGSKAINKDYYHVVIEMGSVPSGNDKGMREIATELEFMIARWNRSTRKSSTFARVYYPVVTNVSCREKTIYDKKNFTFVRDDKNNWIPYRVSNPKLLVGKRVEVTGKVKVEENGDYYVNEIESFKIYDG